MIAPAGSTATITTWLGSTHASWASASLIAGSWEKQSEPTVEAMVRAILPGMHKPRRIEGYLRNGVIRRAHFAAAAEIR